MSSQTQDAPAPSEETFQATVEAETSAFTPSSDSATENPPTPATPAEDQPLADPQDLEDLEFLLDEIEDQIAPLA